MGRRSTRRSEQASTAAVRAAASGFAMGLLWGLLAAGGALGQEFVPAPPDFERPKDDGKSVFAVKPPGTEAAMEDPDQPSVQERLKRANLAMKQWRYQDAMDDVDHVIAQAPKNRQAWLIRTVCRMKLGRAPDDSSLGTELSTLDWCWSKHPTADFCTEFAVSSSPARETSTATSPT